MTNFEWCEDGEPRFEDARAVRTAVFIEEQGFSAEGEFDALDGRAAHVVGYVDEAPACTARLYFDDAGAAHFGRLAVLGRFRGQRLGHAMVAELARRAAEQGASLAVLDAQADKTAFYEKAGFAATGETSLDEGVPHVRMTMLLGPGTEGG